MSRRDLTRLPRRARFGVYAVAVLLLGGCHAEPEGARFVPASGDEPRRRVEDAPARGDRAPAVRRIEMH